MAFGLGSIYSTCNAETPWMFEMTAVQVQPKEIVTPQARLGQAHLRVKSWRNVHGLSLHHARYN